MDPTLGLFCTRFGMPSLKDAFLRVDRARELIGELATMEDAAAKTMVVEELVERIPVRGGEIRRVSIRVTGVPPVPDAAKIRIGEIVYNLRAALDYLVGELSELDSGTRQKDTQFPIVTNLEAFAKAKASRLKGVSDEHCELIRVRQPYDGVVWTRHLQIMSNLDKHNGFVIADNGALLKRNRELRADGRADVVEKFMWLVDLEGHVRPIVDSLRKMATFVENLLRLYEPDFCPGRP
jgi:hypothetical protein